MSVAVLVEGQPFGKETSALKSLFLMPRPRRLRGTALRTNSYVIMRGCRISHVSTCNCSKLTRSPHGLLRSNVATAWMNQHVIVTEKDFHSYKWKNNKLALPNVGVNTYLYGVIRHDQAITSRALGPSTYGMPIYRATSLVDTSETHCRKARLIQLRNCRDEKFEVSSLPTSLSVVLIRNVKFN